MSEVSQRNGAQEAPVVAIVAPGAMGSGVGNRLRLNGASVRTSVQGRSAASGERARKAGLIVVENDDDLVEGADVILSIVPAAESLAAAVRLAPALARARRKPVYADCNAVAPETVLGVAQAVAPTGCVFADVGIFGRPPTEEPRRGPTFYACGPGADAIVRLGEYGLNVVPLDGPVGVASTLKLIHAGITKGFTAVAAAMLLCASQYDLDITLLKQISKGHPELGAWLVDQTPNMFPKAYRWVGEMHELAEFVEEGSPTSDLYRVFARMYESLAQSAVDKDDDYQRLERFVQKAEALS